LVDSVADFLPLRKLTSWTLVQVVEVFANSKLHFSNAWKEWSGTVSAVVSEGSAIGASFSASEFFKLTYLEVGFMVLSLQLP
ncbi:hypothetical protein HN51_070320, partial [Arachis hypogaea]